MKRFLCIWVIAILSICLSACSAGWSGEEAGRADAGQQGRASVPDEEKEMPMRFWDKNVWSQQPDGWLYYMMAEKKKDGDVSYEFSGLNMWYLSIDKCYIPITDSKGNAVDKETARVPNLINHEEMSGYVDKITQCLNECEEDEMEKILSEMELTYLDRDVIVQLYQQLSEKEYHEEYGAFADIPFTDKMYCEIESQLEDAKFLAVTYFDDFGYLASVNIELLNSDEEPFDKLLEQGKLGGKETAVMEVLDEIEEYIVAEQSVDISGFKEKLDADLYYPLVNLLEKMKSPQ